MIHHFLHLYNCCCTMYLRTLWKVHVFIIFIPTFNDMLIFQNLLLTPSASLAFYSVFPYHKIGSTSFQVLTRSILEPKGEVRSLIIFGRIRAIGLLLIYHFSRLVHAKIEGSNLISNETSAHALFPLKFTEIIQPRPLLMVTQVGLSTLFSFSCL